MDRTVHFRSDGLALSPAEYARLLVQLSGERGIAADEFSRDGIVAELEEQMAALLGKEMALFCRAELSPITWRCVSSRRAVAACSCSAKATSTTIPATARRS